MNEEETPDCREAGIGHMFRLLQKEGDVSVYLCCICGKEMREIDPIILMNPGRMHDSNT